MTSLLWWFFWLPTHTGRARSRRCLLYSSFIHNYVYSEITDIEMIFTSKLLYICIHTHLIVMNDIHQKVVLTNVTNIFHSRIKVCLQYFQNGNGRKYHDSSRGIWRALQIETSFCCYEDVKWVVSLTRWCTNVVI